MNEVYFVIPAKAGIQEFQQRSGKLDSRLHGNDDFVTPRTNRVPRNGLGFDT